MNIQPIRAFKDNYIWMLSDSGHALVVDPGDASPVLESLDRSGMALSAILITHHHADHIGGIGRLRKAFPAVRVYAPEDRRIPDATDRVGEGGRVEFPEIDCSLSVIEVPGHTSTHIAYVSDEALFCGDTLFAGGCGRVFDGTAEQLSHSLARIGTLPPRLRVYCAHEYTLANLGFAKWVEPESVAILERERRCEAMRERDEPTVPSGLDEELATNPFMRTDQPAVKAAAERYAGRSLASRAEVFAAIRQWKDREYD